ncbi:RIP metalloprotease RseP [Defluviitalea phaphyphila]|uniref:RIP metalloprotease RseP n=1 Tax=Defluviitalea phaphyphila TaxID=1473580 RepID=UPI00073025AC|nr:RIP metalloprotease RseP [Defluviitalea phaphyphila]
MNILIALLVFGIIVLIHEFGHYIVAKKSGIKVEEFAIGMGPKLISKQYGETLYSIRIFPIGGFCKMLGEDEGVQDERAFSNKSVLTRIAVIAAGPIMNLLLAFIIILFFVISGGFLTTVVNQVAPNTPAEQADIRIGDKIVAIDGKKINIKEEISYILEKTKDQSIEVTILRDGNKIKKEIKPMLDEETGRWMLGIGFEFKEGKENILESIAQSFWNVIFLVKLVIVGFFQIITGQVGADKIAGPVGVIEMIGESYEIGLKTSIIMAIQNVMYLAALISANLGVINLLPIPALDGGRLLFLIIEGLRGKPISVEKEGLIHFIGFVLLMVFMVFILYNDLSKLVA